MKPVMNEQWLDEKLRLLDQLVAAEEEAKTAIEQVQRLERMYRELQAELHRVMDERDALLEELR